MIPLSVGRKLELYTLRAESLPNSCIDHRSVKLKDLILSAYVDYRVVSDSYK